MHDDDAPAGELQLEPLRALGQPRQLVALDPGGRAGALAVRPEKAFVMVAEDDVRAAFA